MRAYLWLVAVAIAVAVFITPVATYGTAAANAAHSGATPRPTAQVVARRMRPRSGSPAPKFGADISERDLFGSRAFANAKVGVALANGTNGLVPARTTDGGRTWTIDGPQLHVNAADGSEGVEYVGIVSAKVEFAYGASVVNVTTNAGHTWWEAFVGENVTAVVPGAHGLVAFLQQQVSSKHLNPIVTWQYVSTDGGRHWRYSTSFAGIS